MDRLKDLKKGTQTPDSMAIDMSHAGTTDSPLHNSSRNMKISSLDEFLTDVEIIQKNIHIIDEATNKIEEINQRMLLATTNEKEMFESQQLNEVIKFANKKASGTKKLLQALKDNTERNKKNEDSDMTSAEIKVRENHLNTLSRKFVEVMKDYQLVQTKYKSDLKGKVRRQVQIVKEDVTNEEIDAIMKSGNGTSKIIQSVILKGDAADSIRNAMENVADKYKDVLVLEASVAELHQMFLDFALLTEQQSELLDQIEYHVKEASEYVDKGNQELTKAIEYTISLRKKQCCCAIIVLILLGALIGIIVGTIQLKGGL